MRSSPKPTALTPGWRASSSLISRSRASASRDPTRSRRETELDLGATGGIESDSTCCSRSKVRIISPRDQEDHGKRRLQHHERAAQARERALSPSAAPPSLSPAWMSCGVRVRGMITMNRLVAIESSPRTATTRQSRCQPARVRPCGGVLPATKSSSGNSQLPRARRAARRRPQASRPAGQAAAPCTNDCCRARGGWRTRAAARACARA